MRGTLAACLRVAAFASACGALVLLPPAVSSAADSPPRIPIEFIAVLARARAWVPGAELVKLQSNAVGPDGRAKCDRQAAGLYDGWSMVLQGGGAIWMVLPCGDGKPVKSFLTPAPAIGGGFIGIDKAIAALESQGVKPAATETFEASLTREGAAAPAWRIRLHGRAHVIDAWTGQPRTPAPPKPAASDGQAPGAPPAEGDLAANLKARHRAMNTVRRRFDAVMKWAESRLKGWPLLAIDALTDERGVTVCSPPSDGWAYYFYNPRLRSFRVVYECEGDIGYGTEGNIPANPARHDAIPRDFIDSHQAVAPLALASKGKKARLSMRLLNYKSPLYPGHALLWEIRVGTAWHHVDAHDAKYVGKK